MKNYKNHELERMFPASKCGVLYKYVSEPGATAFSEKNLREIIINGRIRCTGPKEVNDPFDCRPSFIDDLTFEWWKKYLKANSDALYGSDRSNWLFERMSIPKEPHHHLPLKVQSGELPSKINRKYIRGSKKDYIRLREYIKDLIIDMHNRFPLVSLTEDPCNELMWAHYGNSHKGLCLGFNVENSMPKLFHGKYSPLGCSYQVKYDETRTELPLSLAAPSPSSGTMISFGFEKKSSAWSYEREWRFMRDNYNKKKNYKMGSWLDYGKTNLVSITFGHYSSEQTEDIVRKMIKKSNRENAISIRRAVMSSHDYSIERVNIDRHVL